MNDSNNGRTFYDWISENPNTARFIFLLIFAMISFALYNNYSIKSSLIEVTKTPQNISSKDTLTIKEKSKESVTKKSTIKSVPNHQKQHSKNQPNIYVEKNNGVINNADKIEIEEINIK
jgi:hypothetical protein